MSNDPAPSERSISPMLSTIAIMPDPEPRSYSLFPQVGPKAPREWGVDDLAAFNIQFVEQDATAFYGPDVDLAPSSSVPREFLTAETSREAADPESKRLLRYMEFVRSVNIDDGACVMFLMRLLEAMGYPQAVGDDAVFVCEHEYPLTMYGQRFTGSCAMSIDAGEGRYPVIVHSRTMPVGDVDPRHPPVPHAKIVAMAIADYQYQADLAHRSSVLLLNSEYLRHDHAPRTYAAIMVTGTLPVFFKFTITTQLARAVAEGSMIDHPTVVQVYAPPVTKTNILETVASRCEDNIGLLGRRRLIVEASLSSSGSASPASSATQHAYEPFNFERWRSPDVGPPLPLITEATSPKRPQIVYVPSTRAQSTRPASRISWRPPSPNVYRTPKAPADWGPGDLALYNIVVREEKADAFFSALVDPDLTPSVPSEVLTAASSRSAFDPASKRLLRHMEKARMPLTDYVAVDDFLIRLLDTMGFPEAVDPGAIVLPWRPIPVTVAGSNFTSSVACAVDAGNCDYPLLVHPLAMSAANPGLRVQTSHSQAMLVATAIGAYQTSTALEFVAAAVPTSSGPLQDDVPSRTYAGILCAGTLPTFYKFTVTAELARAVAQGMPAPHQTVVQVYMPQVTKRNNTNVFATCIDDTMMSLDQRRLVLEAYEAFKRHVVSQLRE
ncbi:hypothetical protein PUNSTDRAFT_146498 [Punctularia strigosozonata HHB-11173 SS5]|uniref:Uncharacterized protein n=1 Tax=Punctularia strigosozonata (strain HHB-11173) TaxID=741275 RepID=R7S3Y2_PUNST|nr:uncharacterized protein PUNSTDRAFT_146498 [Punctularia strigosozonata HHB-11173 SS5]EIN04564.1 hypothetical protein PUNSTDRAFT_146498 [Punctularia strigosozonata HHB-11173 SS5]